MSHSKRNTSLAFFTFVIDWIPPLASLFGTTGKSYERSLLKGDYGKQRTRLTRDSFKSFDACNLCMMRARDPVSCLGGDLFCRECAVENLLSQRNEIKRMQAERDRWRKHYHQHQIVEDEEAAQKSVMAFEFLQMGLEIRNRVQQEVRSDIDLGPRVAQHDNRAIQPSGDVECIESLIKSSGTKRKFELDDEEVMRISREERNKAKAALSEERTTALKIKLPSFWVPSLTPSVQNMGTTRKPPRLNPFCPASVKDYLHNYSLKTLVSVKFTEEKEEKTINGDFQRICPACKKRLNNATKAVLATPCGHVICKPCADKFIIALSSNAHDQNKPVRCYVCNADLSDQDSPSNKNKNMVRPGLVLIQSDGTGFSAGGGNVTTEKQGIAFQC
ncbi:hypothetical protein K440DRAFT_665310 [Wilcoxina mikolae CBS 423.85]|nr:hypothetical protein K440DRAFT_665310 [Wilcoxina mikolae CBS 423.85]